MEYALHAKEYHRAAEIIAELGRNIIWTSNVEKLLFWLEALPEEVLFLYPSFFNLHLWSHINLGQFSTAAEELVNGTFERMLDHMDPEKGAYFISSTATVRALISLNWKYQIPEGLKWAEIGLQRIDSKDESGVQAPLNLRQGSHALG